MKNVLNALLNDEAGFIVSAELVLIATLLVIGLIVGLSEVQYAVAEELNDVADAIGSLNQSYYFSGFSACKPDGRIKSSVAGSAFRDVLDSCDNNQCQIACDAPVAEGPKHGHGGHK
ncbi:Flp family type IVb pilin [Planctomicrobium sp. SH661]|uniref:Flp family type IVb pilin n=1 Tax=Planctomicrobium sp. SH661 TaxID=3448124 RepID=UPI003F5C0CC9